MQSHLYILCAQITMTPTLDTKLVNMPPHNFDPAEVPDADMCEFLGGSMGTPGTRRGSPGEAVAAGATCMVRHLSRTGSVGLPQQDRLPWPAVPACRSALGSLAVYIRCFTAEPLHVQHTTWQLRYSCHWLISVACCHAAGSPEEMCRCLVVCA